MTTKTRSIRLETEMFDKIDEKCKGIGCNGNDFIKNAIIEKLEGSNSIIKQEPQEREVRESGMEEPKLKVEVILDSEVKDHPNIIHFIPDGFGKYIQEGVERSKACTLENID